MGCIIIMMELSMMGNELKMKKMGKVLSSTPTATNTSETGSTAKRTARESTIFQTATATKANGKMTNAQEMESCTFPIKKATQDLGLMAKNMAKESMK